jgi:molybdenum cofactor biosynthesis protein B
VRIAVLTVSDTREPREDRSGDVLVERLEKAGISLPIARSSATNATEISAQLGLDRARTSMW